MKRKTIHCISSLTALSLLSGTCAVPVAAEDIQGKIAIVQEKEKLTENDLEQVYHYSYESLGKNLPYTKADTLFSDGLRRLPLQSLTGKTMREIFRSQ